MGLLDQVLGSVLGSRQAGSAAPQASSSMSPLVKAVLLALAAKAYQHYTSRPREAPDPSRPREAGALPADARPRPQPAPGGGPFGDPAGSLGGLGGLLGGLAGAGGLGALIEQFQRSGYNDRVNSWVGRGQNQPISPDELAKALGPDAIDELKQQTGMSRNEMLSELSHLLPEAVDQVTPEGRLPTQEEIRRWV
jgi:uncharacterized protein YidB (DUF937 family)